MIVLLVATCTDQHWINTHSLYSTWFSWKMTPEGVNFSLTSLEKGRIKVPTQHPFLVDQWLCLIHFIKVTLPPNRAFKLLHCPQETFYCEAANTNSHGVVCVILIATGRPMPPAINKMRRLGGGQSWSWVLLPHWPHHKKGVQKKSTCPPGDQ